MRLLAAIPCAFLLMVIVFSTTTVVHAQTASISNLTYPDAIMLNKGTALVSFTVSYSAPQYGTYYLVAGIFDKTTQDFAHGKLLEANPDTCKTPADYSWAAACVMTASKGSNSIDAEFEVALSVPGLANLDAAGALVDSAGNIPTDSFSESPFSINVKNTVTLSLVVPSGVTMSVDGAPQGYTSSVSLDLRAGAHLIAVPGLVTLKSGGRLKFDHWSDGSTDATRSLDLEDDTRLQATYVTQFNLTLISSGAVPNGAGWYDSGSSADISITSTYPMTGILGDLGGKWVFSGWYEGKNLSFSSPNGSVKMDASHTLTAGWAGDYTQPGIILGIVVAVIILAVFWIVKHRKSTTETETPSPDSPDDVTGTTETDVPVIPGTPMTQPTLQAEEQHATGEKSTMFCSQCGAKISRSSKFCNECGTTVES